MSRLSAADVDDMDVVEASDWLEERGIPYEHLVTSEEMILLIKQEIQREMVTHDEASVETDENGSDLVNESQAKMEEILSKDAEMKERLADIYIDIINFVKTRVGQELREVLADLFQNFDEKLQTYMDELVNDECPIVVAGETSAGKSSLLNLLLGTEVLPYSLLCATSTICRLHHSISKRFEIVYDGRPNEVHEIQEGQDDKALIEELKATVSSDKGRKERICKQVEIYWPIPMLQNRVTIVDTPGVGESMDMTNRLFEYLPNAIAFIYVVNSPNSGGLQDDKLLHVISEQRRWEDAGGLSSFDPNCTMFVLNKWDLVEKREAEDMTWSDSIEKLKKLFPELPDSQIFKMSTTEAKRYLKSNMGYTQKYERLLKGIEELVPASLFGKINRHFRWMSKFLDKLQSAIAARVNHARNTEEEKKRLHETVLRRLNILNMDANKVKDKLIEEAEIECSKMATLLFNHLKQDDVVERLRQWREHEAPNIEADDFEVTKFKGDELIMSRIKEEVRSWESANGFVKNASERLTHLFKAECRILGQEANQVNLVLEGNVDEFSFMDIDDRHIDVRNGPDGNFFTRSEKIILAIASPLWVPIVTAASLLFLPVGIGMLIKESFQSRQQRKEYMNNKVRYMQQWTDKVIEMGFTRENIDLFIRKSYFETFRKKIQELCEDYIPKRIAADRRQVNNIANDRRTSQEILRVFQPLQKGLRQILAKLRLFELKFMALDVIDVRCLRKKREIGGGNFSVVYLASWQTANETTDVALKVPSAKLSETQMYPQLTEVECLRALRHQNVVEYLGVCYSDHLPALESGGGPEPLTGHKLMLVFEMCACSLQDLVFNRQDLQCGHCRSVGERQGAFTFYTRMAMGVCDGLAFIHEKKYLHRDLKLANVLLKNGIAKLCDFGFTRMEAVMTGSFVGTMTHMSPELLEGKRYSYSHDIYSLSILLWELWYGRYVYSDPEFETVPHNLLLDAIKTGRRPKCSVKYAMVKELTSLLENCWDEDPDVRLPAVDVGLKLRAIYRHYHDIDIDRVPHTPLDIPE